MVWLTNGPHLSDKQELNSIKLVNSITALDAGWLVPGTANDVEVVLSSEVAEEISVDVEIVASLLAVQFNENKWSLWNERSGIAGSKEYYDMLAKIIEKNLLKKYNDVDKDYLLRCLDDSLKARWLHLYRPSKIYSENNVGPNWDELEDNIVKYRISEL